MRILASLLFTLVILLNPQQARAQSMSNSSYKIDLNSQDTSTQTKTKDAPAETPANNGQPSSRNIKGDNYSIEVSYADDTRQLPFLVSISADNLNFGKLDAGEALIRSHSISVSPGSSHGFQVLSQEDHNLESDGKEQIPNTSCDSGSCNQVLSDQWEVPLTYGFGYTCKNIKEKGCAGGFENGYYKRPANLLFDEKPEQIIYGAGKSTSESILLYKINVSPTQPKKTYSNSINYIFAPNL